MAAPAMRGAAFTAVIAIVALIIGLGIGIAIPSPFRAAPSAGMTATISIPYTVTQTPSTTAKEIKLALFVADLGHPYFKSMVDGARAAVEYYKNLGFKISLDVFDGRGDPAQQVNQIETAIGKGYSAFLVNPIQLQSAEPALRKAKDAGIPVITVDRDTADKSLRMVFVGTDNVKAAEVEAQIFISMLQASGKPKPWKIVMLQGTAGASTAEDRKKGFHNVIDPLVSRGDVVVVYEDYADFRSDVALSKVESVLSKTRDIDGIIAANDEMILGAIKALENAGLQPCKQVITYGFDAIAAAVQAVKEGKLCGTIGQAAFLQGFWGALVAIYHVAYGWKPNTDWIQTPVVPVTKENMEWFGYVISAPRPLPIIQIEPTS